MEGMDGWKEGGMDGRDGWKEGRMDGWMEGMDGTKIEKIEQRANEKNEK